MTERMPRQIACFRYLAAAALLLLPLAARAQVAPPLESSVHATPLLLASVSAPAGLEGVAPSVMAAESSSSLPDDPASVMAAQQDPKASLPPSTTTQSSTPAPKYAFDIAANEEAQHLKTKEKIALGFRHLADPLGFVGVVVSAGYTQATNGQPNFGTDRGAFGQRLGAAELRDLSQGIFTDVLLHPLMHTDARYYVKGSNYSFGSRTKYAVTRLFVTTKDDGGHTVNSALLLGYLEAASMTRFYYPTNNKNFKDLMTGYGGSLGGAALGFFVSEFSGSLLKAVHMKH